MPENQTLLYPNQRQGLLDGGEAEAVSEAKEEDVEAIVNEVFNEVVNEVVTHVFAQAKAESESEAEAGSATSPAASAESATPPLSTTRGQDRIDPAGGVRGASRGSGGHAAQLRRNLDVNSSLPSRDQGSEVRR